MASAVLNFSTMLRSLRVDSLSAVCHRGRPQSTHALPRGRLFETGWRPFVSTIDGEELAAAAKPYWTLSRLPSRDDILQSHRRHRDRWFRRRQTRPPSAIHSGQYKLIHFVEEDRVELYDLSNDLSEQGLPSLPIRQVRLCV
jgi:hypothetical protein